MRDELLKLISVQDVLLPFPEVLLRLDKKLRDPHVNNNDVVNLVRTDPALSGQVLRMANSAFYGGGRREITNLLVALTRIGHKSLREIVYSYELSKMFEDSRIIDQHKFWLHSLAVAVFSHALSERVREPAVKNEIAYYSGLMHDVGVMIFAYLIPDEYTGFLDSLTGKDIPLEEQEFSHFGIDHAELGASFIEKWWPVGDEVVKAVRRHHNPPSEDEDKDKTVFILNVANALCNSKHIDNGINVFHADFNESVWFELGLNLEEVPTIVEKVSEIVAHSERLLNVP